MARQTKTISKKLPSRPPDMIGEAFSSVWPVFEDYRVEDGMLVYGDQIREHKYSRPSEMPSIVFDLAALARGSDQDVVDFAKHWGSLGYGQLIGRVLAPEPIEWIRAHAQGLWHVLQLLHYIQFKDPGLGTYLASLVVPIREPHFRVDSLPTMICGSGPNLLRVAFTGRFNGLSDREQAWEIVRDVIEPNLKGISPTLVPLVDAEGLVVKYQFRALVNIVYWHAARLAEGVGGIGTCVMCGGLFLRTDRRQRFCPPKSWELERSPGAESACGRRYRSKGRGGRGRVEEVGQG